MGLDWSLVIDHWSLETIVVIRERVVEVQYVTINT